MTYQAVAADGSWFGTPTERLSTAKRDAERFRAGNRTHANVIRYETIWSTQTLDEAIKAMGAPL